MNAVSTMRRKLNAADAGLAKAPIEKMSPIRVAIMGVGVWVALFIIAPVTVVTPQSLAPYLFLLLGYGSFFFGCLFVRAMHVHAGDARRESEQLSDRRLLLVHKTVVVVAICGALLKAIDIFVVRSVNLAGSVLDRRDQLDSVGANPVSIICAIVLPACLLTPYTFMLLRQRGLATRTRSLIAHSLFLVPILSAVVVSGSRSSIFVYLVIYALYLTTFGRLKIKAKTVVFTFMAALVFLVASTAIFNNRLEAMHLRTLDSVYTSGYAFTIQPQPWIGSLMANHEGLVGDSAFAVLVTLQYYLHGIFEFVYQYQNAPPIHTYGAESFNAFYKLIAKIFDWPGPDELYVEVTPRTGIYTSFLGPVYADFGWLGLIYMMALGALAQNLWKKSADRNVGALPMYCYFVLIIFLFPVSNFIVGTLGLYNLTVFAIFYWLLARGEPKGDMERRAYSVFTPARRRFVIERLPTKENVQ